ncbi:hypothetical protein [Selenomonas sp. AB3002]|uniref:hypothetical protein n=1 Tax=Selenomonas sp. AB3002 TaxID=1392502 RepID=UPI00049568B1
MTWWKNGLLLAAGGVAGLALAAWLESECEKSGNFTEGQDGQADGMELLVDKIRQEAEAAMEGCNTEEDREKVYTEVESAIRELQATLKQRGEEIIADLKEKALNGSELEEEEDCETAVRNFKGSMEDLTKALDEMLASIKPEPSV